MSVEVIHCLDALASKAIFIFVAFIHSPVLSQANAFVILLSLPILVIYLFISLHFLSLSLTVAIIGN